MIHPPSLTSLAPQVHLLPHGKELYYFANSAVGLVRLDFTMEAGSACQQQSCQAHAAGQLFGEASTTRSAEQVAQFMDYRGIIVERNTDSCTSCLTFYFLRKFAEELLPLVRELFDHPTTTPQLFKAYAGRRRQQLAEYQIQTVYAARNRYYETIFGSQHPLGRHAVPSDLDHLSQETVEAFIGQHYSLAEAHIVVSGCIDDGLLALADQYLSVPPVEPNRIVLPAPMVKPPQSTVPQRVRLQAASPQASLRIGRRLPWRWNSPQYARFMVLNTALGGYFGSRLMTNLREEKGYTYGIYSHTQILRGHILFYITADVAAETADAAVDEINHEIERLQQEPLPHEELDRVRNYMMGDFIRSMDGVFELAELFRSRTSTDVGIDLSAHLLDAIQSATPADLQSLAQTALESLCTIIASS